jgi:nuclear receptor co-repressor 1
MRFVHWCGKEAKKRIYPVACLTAALELVQHEDFCSGDFRSLTNSSKLLLLKESIAKEVEKTELEMDLLECYLKLVTTESENRALESVHPSPSSCWDSMQKTKKFPLTHSS